MSDKNPFSLDNSRFRCFFRVGVLRREGDVGRFPEPDSLLLWRGVERHGLDYSVRGKTACY